MKPIEPIFTIDLFPKIDQKLIKLLQSLSAEDWQKPTIAPLWKVKDIAAHLLDGNIRNLSLTRDGYVGAPPESIHTYQDLVTYLNQLNADWVQAMKRVSPAVLINLLEITSKQYNDYLKTLHPFDKAIFSVAWAGESESENWFHIAREYTEKWHHQQQIRLAVGQEQALFSAAFYFPYLDTSMRALPFHYKNMTAKSGDLIKFIITGEGGGVWWLYYDGKKWDLVIDCELNPISTVEIDGAIAWRIFTKGISKSEAAKRVVTTGDKVLGSRVLDMLAVMA